MEWLNYHHLYYFWQIEQEGSLSRAASKLRLTHSTMSAQLRTLEEFLGQPLFDRRGRRLVLTQFGTEVARYAGDIFRLGRELVEIARGRSHSPGMTLRVGVVSSMPKTIVYRFLEPALASGAQTTVQVHQAELESLLNLLARNLLHCVLADQPASESTVFRVHTHRLGETEILLYGEPRLANRYTRGFPKSLRDAPILLPSKGALRSAMEKWFADRDIRVSEAGTIDDAGLLRVFGAFGQGLFPVRSVLASEVEETHDVRQVGRMTGIRETYYLISQKRQVTHPLVIPLIESGQRHLIQRRSKRTIQRIHPTAKTGH